MGTQTSKKKQLKRSKKKNERIDKSLQKDSNNLDQQIKLLLLGSGGSGKTTLIKQIHLIYKDGFDPLLKELYKKTIRKNLVIHTVELIEGMKRVNLSLQPQSKLIASKLINFKREYCDETTPNLKKVIKFLWKDPNVKRAFQLRSVLQIPETHGYYLNNIDRITEENYVPSETDILKCRIPTTGVNTVDFNLEGLTWTIVDVGGQRSERRKWIHQFESVQTIIYIVAISEYDQKLYENENVNRLKEAFDLFETTINNEYFEKTNCVLLFNKMDLFEEKIKKVPLSECFSEYKDGSDSSQAKKFISNKFLEIFETRKRKIWSYSTCATDTNKIRTIFENIKELVMETILNKKLL
ncbi:guanine nucleotide-binding protein g(o) subunit alpha [Anaeramoeba flamelloides]|uniref:Guanine nucleotide-binding protein g(O) subunit alpha n=1 Tax=Anaeramoeba flamelloides TaxID=1746091 RepID=A0AAV8ABH9_9EUKA|nr:guanine nucleotide-binding protein g(o) subunit alpha [Anaeramoeba flamelloides]